MIVDENDVLESVPRGELESRQIYEDDCAETLICKLCGGDIFKVGQGHCLTVVKCVACNWEANIHDG